MTISHNEVVVLQEHTIVLSVIMLRLDADLIHVVLLESACMIAGGQ